MIILNHLNRISDRSRQCISSSVYDYPLLHLPRLSFVCFPLLPHITHLPPFALQISSTWEMGMMK